MALNFKPLQYEPGGSMYAPRIGEDTWNAYRPQIEQLYIGHGKTLDEVMAVMANDHNFRPTESQYKIQFRRWKLRKNRVGGVAPPPRVESTPGAESSSATTMSPDTKYPSEHYQTTYDASPSMSTMSLSPQITVRTEMSMSSMLSPGVRVTSYSSDTLTTPKANAASLTTSKVNAASLVSLNQDRPLPEIPTLPSLSDSFPPMISSSAELQAPISEEPKPQHADSASPPPPPPTDDDRFPATEPPPPASNRLSGDGGELHLLTASLLDCLITVACDQQKIAELNEEGCFWILLVARHLCGTQSKEDPMSPVSVILQALFKYKQANVFYPNAKMSTMSVLTEIAPTTDVRDLVQQIGWIFAAKSRAEGGAPHSQAGNAQWSMARSNLGSLYRIRGQYTEASDLSDGALEDLQKLQIDTSSYRLLTYDHLHHSYLERGDPQLAQETRNTIDSLLEEPGNSQQTNSVKYFFEHCYQLLETTTLLSWSGYDDFKEFASLIQGLCGPIHWRTTTLFTYFWLRWRELDSRERTLNNIARSMGVGTPDLIGAFVTLLYARMPGDYQLPPIPRLFEDAAKSTKLVSADPDLCVSMRKAWFSSFTKYGDFQGGLDPSAASAIATRAIAMSLCDPAFSSLRELLSSEKYQRLPNAIPTLSMTPRSSLSRFRPSSIEPSGASIADRSMKDGSSVVDLPSNFMRRSWSSLGSGLLLGQRVSSLRSFYTGKSSRRTRDSKMMERTWESDDEDDGDVKMLE